MTADLLEKPKIKWGEWVETKAITFTWPMHFSFTAIEECDKPTTDYQALPPLTTEKVADRFTRELHAVIREAGEYHVCRPRAFNLASAQFKYVWQDEPDCVVGRVLHRMGISTETLARMEGTSAEAVIRACWGMGDLHGSEEDLRVVRNLASAAQMMNDSGQPWGLMRHINPKNF